MGAPPPAKKGKGLVFWILTGCCGCLLLVMLCGGGFFGLVYTQTQPAATGTCRKSGPVHAHPSHIERGERVQQRYRVVPTPLKAGCPCESTLWRGHLCQAR